MPKSGFTFRVTGFDKLRRGLKAAEKVFSPAEMRETFGDFALILERSILRNFERERAPRHVAPLRKAESRKGRRWHDLKPATIKRRRGGGAGAKILQDTGTLMGSINSRATSKYAVAGTNSIIGLYHQGGTKRGLPPRPFIGFNDKDADDMISAVTIRLKKALPGGS